MDKDKGLTRAELAGLPRAGRGPRVVRRSDVFDPERGLTRADIKKYFAGEFDPERDAYIRELAAARGWSDDRMRDYLEYWVDPDQRMEFIEECMRSLAEMAEAAQDAIAKIHGRTLDADDEPQRPRVDVAADTRPPSITTFLADTLARHAPPARALTPSTREARAT